MNCTFCNKEVIEKQKIFETETEYVIYNIRAANKGHCLVLPKRHVTNIRELTDTETSSLLRTVKLVSDGIKKHFQPAGFNYGFNESTSAGQTIEHFHFHILPRFDRDNLPEFHLFHRNPQTKRTLPEDELRKLVKEFIEIF